MHSSRIIATFIAVMSFLLCLARMSEPALQNAATLLWAHAKAEGRCIKLDTSVVRQGSRRWTNNDNPRLAAYRALAECDFEGSIASLEATLKENPNHCTMRFHLGQLLLNDGQRRYAVEVFQRDNCNIDRYFLNQAEVAIAQQDLQDAQAMAELALEISPRSYAALLHLGTLVRSQPERALALLLRAKDVEPDRPDAYVEIGQVYELELKQYREALEWYTLALEQFPDNVGLYRYVARVHMQQGLFEQALLEIRRAPVNSYNNYLLGEIHRRRGDLKSAIDYYTLAVDQRPEVHAWRLTLADLLAKDSQYCSARQQYASVHSKAARSEVREAARQSFEQLGGFCGR